MIPEEDKKIEKRFERNTYLVLLVAVTGGWIWSGWRMALGVLLGGALSIFNKRWLQGSVRAILDEAVVTQNARVPGFTASKLILRYFIIAVVIGAGVWTGSFDPIGIGIGFAAFVGGVMMESVYQLYLFFKSNEPSSENSSKE
ncbi:MAG TPA: ATP synthase subunit I [Blastocatellia bacterium]|nr:ATP synthase subunit I [Blastocatellia bacterium]